MEAFSDDWGKPDQECITLRVAPKPGGAVTGTVLLQAGRRPEPTQRGHGGGQVDTLTPDGGQQSGATYASQLYQGLGGERQARKDDDSGHLFLPFPANVVLKKKDKAYLTNSTVGVFADRTTQPSPQLLRSALWMRCDELLRQADDLHHQLEGG